MPVRSLTLCNLVAIWFETLLYGIYVSTLIPTLYILLYRPFSVRCPHPSLAKINQAHLAGALALLIFSTAHVATSLAMLLEAFVFFPDTSSESYFVRTADPLNILRAAAFLASIVFADAFMIHRAYVQWHRSVLIILPPLFSLTLAVVSGILVFTLSSKVSTGPQLLASSSISISFTASLTPTLRILIPVYVAMLFVTNSWISLWAGIRLWQKGNAWDEDQYSWKWRLFIFIGESGVIYTLTALAALVLSLAGTNGQIIPYTALTPLAAILPTLMILTVDRGYPFYSPFSRQPRALSGISNLSLMAPSEKVLAADGSATTRMSRASLLSPDPFHAMPVQEAHVGPKDEVACKPAGTTQGDTPLAALKDACVPPVPCVSPPRPLAGRCVKERSVPALNLTCNLEAKALPPISNALTPRTPRTPRSHVTPSPYETHFPRSGRTERISQQTFNPKRENAGKGGTAYTTFGDSSLARMLATTKDGAENSQSAPIPDMPDNLGRAKNQGKERKDKRKRPDIVNPDLPPGVYMTKAVERRIDYIADQAP